jgi:hypothetical protein
LAVGLAALLILVCLSSCAVPIAPGYRIAKESRDIRFVPGSPPSIQVRAAYTLVNSGTSDLNFVDVTLPLVPVYGRADLKAEVDGHAANFDELPAELQFDSPDALRLSFGSPWKQGQSHDVTIEYSFRSPAQGGSQITLGDADFHLGSRGAFAVLEPPKHILAPFPKRPKEMYYMVRVPSDFRVLARGTLAGRKQTDGETEYRYRLLAEDLAPYVVAGRYVQSVPRSSSDAVFWTFQPVSIDAATAGAIAGAWNTLQKDYGPLDKNIHVPHVVEVTDLPVHITREQGPAAVAFPGGALVNAAALAQGAQGDAFVEIVSHAFAHNWFGDQIYSAADATLGLGEGLPEYATIVIDEARGGRAARSRRIRQYLSEYDAALKQGTEETLAVSRLTDPPAERRIALAKAPLFFAALEDECGAEAMRSALNEVVTLLRGQEVSYPVVRSALEGKSGKNLAPTFRLWLNEKGIPADFRARYSANTSSGPAGAR